MAAFVWTWTGRELRRRRPALVVLTLLIAVTATTVFAALAGARRQASVGTRLAARTAPADVALLVNTPGYPWARVRALPQVATLATFGFTLPVVGLPPDAEAEPILGTDMLRTIERPVVRSGRMFDRTRTDEAVVTPGFAGRYGRTVGDTVDVVLPTPAELRQQAGTGPRGAYTGPRLHLHVVGEVVSPG
jgi:hypothetical protein